MVRINDMHYDELLNLLEKVSRALEILINYRVGKEISKEEKENFKEYIIEIGEKLGFSLPLHGKIVTKVLLRKPWIMEKLGVAGIINELLFLLLRMSKEICTKELDKRSYSINEDQLSKIKGNESYKGYVYEALGRLWLREVIGRYWSNVEYFIYDNIDIDAISKERSGDIIFIYAAEIKSGKIKRDDIDKFVNRLNSLKQYWKEEMKHDKTIKKI